jgi:uncharacterized membrane protein YidH (DUF202 family)
MAVLIIATVGAFVQIEGASWDVTSHLLKRPETFFTPSHIMLYTGVGLLIISAALYVCFTTFKWTTLLLKSSL